MQGDVTRNDFEWQYYKQDMFFMLLGFEVSVDRLVRLDILVASSDSENTILQYTDNMSDQHKFFFPGMN